MAGCIFGAAGLLFPHQFSSSCLQKRNSSATRDLVAFTNCIRSPSPATTGYARRRRALLCTKTSFRCRHMGLDYLRARACRHGGTHRRQNLAAIRRSWPPEEKKTCGTCIVSSPSSCLVLPCLALSCQGVNSVRPSRGPGVCVYKKMSGEGVGCRGVW